MIELEAAEAPAALRSFLSLDVPGKLRFSAVLAGTTKGKIWTDNPQQTNWAIVQELSYGTLCLEGNFPDGLLDSFISTRQPFGDVLYGFWEDDKHYESQLPPASYNGHVWESSSRSPEVNLSILIAMLPPDTTLKQMDAEIFPRTLAYSWYSDMFGSSEQALKMALGYCLMRGDEILCEAFAGISADGLIEMGVDTHEKHRKAGYATITCAALIDACEKRGYQTYWNCNEQNLASIALAHKLGYTPMKKYRLLAW
jgi:hypothetical protein